MELSATGLAMPKGIVAPAKAMIREGVRGEGTMSESFCADEGIDIGSQFTFWEILSSRRR